MIESHWVRPSVRVLQAGQREQVHAYALRILEQVGLRVDSARAREIFQKRVGRGAMEGRRVHLPGEVVEWAIEAAPSQIQLYSRLGDPTFALGEEETRFGMGVTTLYYQDPISEELTAFGREELERVVRLGDSLPNLDAISTPGIVQDVPPELSDLHEVLGMVANTIKPLVILISDERVFPTALDLLEALHEDPIGRPFAIPYLNPITPLILNAGTAEKMLVAIERELPVIYSSFGMAGASTPITLVGSFSLLLAELLGGLTLSQLAREGAPVVLGCLPGFFDMRSLVSFYDTQTMLLNLACAEMMAHYRIPHCGTSGSTTGWGPGLEVGSEMMMNHLTSCMGVVGLAPFVGSVHGGKVFSPSVVVYADEVIARARRFARGFSLREEDLAFDEIVEVGPGGSFLSSERTVRMFRGAYDESKIFPRISMETWLKRGRPEGLRVLREHTRDLLAGLKAREDHEALMTKGEAFIRRRADSLY